MDGFDDDVVSLAGTTRVHDRTVMQVGGASFFGDVDPLNIEQDTMTPVGVSGAEELNLAMVNERASLKFTGGDGAPSPVSDERLVQCVTLLLIKLAREAVHDLFHALRPDGP